MSPSAKGYAAGTAVAAAYLVAAWANPPASPLHLVAWLVAALAAGPLTAIDVTQHRLPDRLTRPLTGIILALLAADALATTEWAHAGIALLCGAGLALGYLGVALAAPGAVGLGDVKLAAPVGLLLGWSDWHIVITGTTAAFLLASLAAIAGLVTGRMNRHSHLAFGPFLLLGAAAAYGAQALTHLNLS